MYLRRVRSIVVVVGLIALLIAATHAKKAPQFFSGQTIKISEAPYIVQLRDAKGQKFCTGTLVKPKFVVTADYDPEFVVTAAHCFDNISYKHVKVAGGTNKLSDEGQQRKIFRFLKASSYSREYMNSDIAILQLDGPMVRSETTMAVPLCRFPLIDGQSIQVSGWGLMTYGGLTSEQMKTGSLKLRSPTECEAFTVSSGIKLTPSMICATAAAKQDSCYGDSGGPGIYDGELCAIQLWSKPCYSSTEGDSSVYINVHALKDIVEDVIKSFEIEYYTLYRPIPED